MEAAMKSAADKYNFSVIWHPFFLRPNMPSEGIEKPPDTPDNPRVHPRLKAAGAAVGIDFTGKTDRYPNTLLAHCLLDFAKNDPKIQDQISEALFKAYFTDGFVTDEPTLLRIAEGAGLNVEQVQAALKDDKRKEAVQQQALSYSQRGVSGVPYFYMNGQKAFSGAQEPQSFIRMFEMLTE